jgi:hypothetical protein
MIPRGLLAPLVALALAVAPLAARAQTSGKRELFVVVLGTATTTTQQLPAPLPAAFRGNQLYWRALGSGESVT